MARYGEGFRNRVLARMLPPESAAIGDISSSERLKKMAGKQALLMRDEQIALALRKTRWRRHAVRDRAMLLLSFKAGLRAAEIAQLTWPMVLRPDGRLGDHIALADRIAKKGSGRTIPLHPSLRVVLDTLRRQTRRARVRDPI